MARDGQRPRKHVKVVEIQPINMERFAGDALPVRSIRVNLGGDRKGIVFTISKKARDCYDLERFTKLAQTLGDLVHPHPATIVVLPDGEELHAYEVGTD